MFDRRYVAFAVRFSMIEDGLDDGTRALGHVVELAKILRTFVLEQQRKHLNCIYLHRMDEWMTLLDLFNRLDWSYVRDNPDRWYNLYTKVDGKPLVGEDYFKRFWCNVIYCAFYGEDKALQQTATELLLRNQMWDKVVDELKKGGFINDE